MGVYNATWEDDENNRKIELEVEYSLENDRLELISATPKSIQFVDPMTKQDIRQIRVWTEKGRRLVIDQFHSRADLAKMQQTIAESLLAPAE